MFSPAQRKWWIALALILLAAGLWAAAIRQERERLRAEGAALFARIDRDEIFAALERAPLQVRAGFLREALARNANARHLRVWEQAVVLSLTGLRFEDAQELDRQILQPILAKQKDREILATARSLRVRWSLERLPEPLEKDPPKFPGGDVEGAKLIQQMLASRNAFEIAHWAAVLREIRTTLSEPAAQHSADQLAERLFTERDLSLRTRLVIAFSAIADSWDPARANAFAAEVVDRMRYTEGAVGLRIFALALRAIPANPIYARAGANLIAANFTLESALGLRALAGKADPAVFDRAARAILEELEEGEITEAVEAVEILWPYLKEEHLQAAARILIQRDPAWLPGFPVTPQQVEGLLAFLSHKGAPCDLVLGLPEPARAEEARKQIYNRHCSEESWRAIAVAILGEEPEEQEMSVEALAGVEDDDARGDDTVDVDFAALSRALSTKPITPH